MNYPLAFAILGFVAQDHLDRTIAAHQGEVARGTVVRDGPAFGAELERLMGLYDRSVTEVQLNLLDSHDSPRFRTLTSRDEASWRLATLLQATLPGAPCIYYGDEVGVEGDHAPDCRRSFPLDPSTWNAGSLAWTRAVLRLRHDRACLRRGAFRIVGAGGDAVAYLRTGSVAGDAVLVAVNAGAGRATLDLTAPELAGGLLVAAPLPDVAAGRPVAVDAEGRLTVAVPGRGAVVLSST